MAAFTRAVAEKGLGDVTLLAFGFGYDVKSLLLRQLADAAGGASSFAFICDGSSAWRDGDLYRAILFSSFLGPLQK